MISLVNSCIIGRLRELHKVPRIKHLAQILGNSGFSVLDFSGNPQEGGEGQRVSHSCERAAVSRATQRRHQKALRDPASVAQLRAPQDTTAEPRKDCSPQNSRASRIPSLVYLHCHIMTKSTPLSSSELLVNSLCVLSAYWISTVALESWVSWEGGDTSQPEDVVTYGGEDTQVHHAAPQQA